MKIGILLREILDISSNLVLENGDFSENNKTTTNPFDEFAIEASLKQKDLNNSLNISLFSYGNDKTINLLRNGIAMGADNAYLIEKIDNFKIYDIILAKILKKTINKEGINIFLTGNINILDNNTGFVPILASVLGWNFVSSVLKFEIQDNYLDVLKKNEYGESIKIKVKLPCVLGIIKGDNSPRIPVLKNIMIARKKEIIKINPKDNDENINFCNQYNSIEISQIKKEKQCKIIEGSDYDKAMFLFNFLKTKIAIKG